ncbi:MAG TPA: M48 family metallopeptidase [Planctomycetaceae bacterium]|jgi:predicted Zn-dependent protease
MKNIVFAVIIVALLGVIGLLLLRNDKIDARRPDVVAGAAQELPGKILDDIGEILPNRKKTENEGRADSEEPVAEAPPERPQPQDVVTGLFGLAEKAAKAADDVGQEALALDTEDEIRLGKEANAVILEELESIAELDEQLNRIKRLAKPFLDSRQRKDISYTFAIVDDPVVNAFSILGGYVYLNTGLLDFAASDAELQFVIGHEIGHVDLNHCVKKFTYATRAAGIGTEIAGNMTQIVYHLVALGFSEDQELACDEYAFRRMLTFGRSRDEALEFSRRFAARPDASEEAEPPQNVLSAFEKAVNDHFRSHPPDRERVRRLEAIKINVKEQ